MMNRNRQNQALNLREPIAQNVEFKWGLDTKTPKRQVDPGVLRQGQNIEIDINGGYLTPTGYERVDGQVSPSDAFYSILEMTVTGSFSDLDLVTGGSSGATGVIVVGGVVTGVAQDYLVLTKVTGTFSNGESLLVSASPEGTAVADSQPGAASTPLLHAQYLNLAADVYRLDIGAVPGTGEILGLWFLDDIDYAFRNETSFGLVELTGGASGSVDGITVDGIEIMSGAESFDTDLPTTAAAVAANINAFTSSPNYTASAVNSTVKIRALAQNTFAVVSSTTTITSSDTNMAGHGLTAECYKSSATGWQLVPFGFKLAFTSGGVTEISVGDTLTGDTSGATAVITGVSLESGTWAAGTAAGTFTFASQTGTFQAEEVNTALATIAEDSSAIEFLGDGRFDMVTHNFGGQAGSEKIYGCDTVNKGFEFDGTTFIPITTGMTIDTPNFVYPHKNHLFFAFDGSAQHSGIGAPFTWTPITGAGELALGDRITGFVEQPSGAPPTDSQSAAALSIFSRNRIHTLYGSSSSDWDLAPYRREVGAYAYSAQEFGRTFMLDDRGVTTLETVQAFGNFSHEQITRLIQDFVNEKKLLVTASCIARDKSQYRLYFSDKTALYITTEGGKAIGLCGQLLADKVTCMYSLEDSTGAETIKFGSTDGFVYQMEKGTSHDGEAIEVVGSLHYNHSGAPRREKHYQDVSFEVEGSGYAEFSMAFSLGYGSTDFPQGETVNLVTNLQSVSWDSFTWDAFTWDGQTILPTQANLDGTAENISLIIRSEADYFSPILLSGVLMHFMWGVALRG